MESILNFYGRTFLSYSSGMYTVKENTELRLINHMLWGLKETP